MSSQRTSIARQYHESTKLTYINLHNKPPLYKSYPGLPVIPLPDTIPVPEAPALEAVAGADPDQTQPVGVETLAALLYFSAGIIKKRTLPEVGEVHYRAAASAGALYPIETYVVCQDMPGLSAGVYHFSPNNFSLVQLKEGDYRGALAEAAAGHQSIANSAVTFVFTSIFWRSTWKYRARGYRYCLWDNGTMVANLVSTASSLGLPSVLLLGFVDGTVDRLVGVDGEREATICLVGVGQGDPQQRPPDAEELSAPAEQPVRNPAEEFSYSEIRQVHSASLLHTAPDVRAWRGSLSSDSPRGWDSLYLLDPADYANLTSRGLGQVIRRRGSTRRFARESITFPDLSSLLDRSTRGLAADFLDPDGKSLVDAYIIVNAVDGLPPGAYFFSPEPRGLEPLEEGDFREEAGHLCFEQALGADASAVVFLMSGLEKVLERYGDRGYRAAQLEAGIVGGKLYLGAHSLGMGASGITFYDDAVADFFSPHAANKSTMFVVTLGKTGRPNRVQPFRSQVAVRLDALARGAGQV